MINVSKELKELLESRNSEIITVVELYSRDTIDISSISAPKNAIGKFSDKCFTWENSTGSYDYEAKIVDFPSVKTYLDDSQNECQIELSNVARGEGSGSRFVLDNQIKGTWMVIRLIFPDLPDESWVIWWGKSLRPGKIDNKTVSLSATQEIGNYKIKIPFRSFAAKCPLTPGKGECLGNQSLSEKSALYQKQYDLYGTMLCPDRTYTTCVKLENDRFFQGQRLVALTGQFSYVSKDEDPQKKNKKKNIPNIKTESWSSFNQSDSNDVVPLAFGRCQIAGHPFSWSDTGTQVNSLQGFCEGRISDFDFIRCRNPELTLGSVIEHYGDFGGSGTQTPDTLFGGFSGYNSKLAYLEVTTTGSKPENVDDAPLITAVIRGMQLPVPDVHGQYTLSQTSDNPVHITRFLLTEQKFGRIPTYRMEDTANLLTADYCDELVEDRSQCESIILPENEASNYNIGYRRYRSTSIHTAYTDMYNNNYVTGIHPDFQHPHVKWYRPFNQQPLLPPQNVLRRRFTINGHLQEETPLLDFLQKRILPCFRGWLNYNRNGKIEIRTRQPADNAYLRATTNIEINDTVIPITNISKWRSNLSGHLIIGVSELNAEVRRVKRVLYSPGCNSLPITYATDGDINIKLTPISGGSLSNQGIGYIDISGEIPANTTVTFFFNSEPNQYYISYTTDGIEDAPCLARMLTAYFNANPDFANYLTAYVSDYNTSRINIRCEAGYLELDEPLEYNHQLGEEVMRVAAVFENCNDLFSDNSASFDNIVVDSFTWNDGEQDDQANAYTADFVQAVDDFHVETLIPRTAWDTIEQEAELNIEKLDLKFVDNYWQAAYITKTVAIENIDGNLPFTWRTGLSGFMLEMGDVVAIRHDSGDGSLRYTPVWIKAISYDLKGLTTNIDGRLYLSGAWDHRVQAIEPVLVTTLSKEFPEFPPSPIGSTGGAGGASEYKIIAKQGESFFDFSRYSIEGNDLV